MKINDFLVEAGADFASDYIKNLKDKDPERLEEINKLICNFTDVAINLLKESSEFRKKFAEIHAEFLKHPECKQVIDETLNSVSKYRPDLIKK
ncbi:hypothetical protein CLPU_7c00280 [Gottschalkia purinilytica]|uniref:Uncharacterized protein n=1 Tax=Gottschalkia purinilytica TaxID=1503 RepID=A0A0L0WAP5_GOTPU|nr:hypothetical protein [Gottschalkia purinilytica]KNF08400.1 hypothetical protein CLPU_7c00280 [Gottschalkia purinilytica]